MIDFPKKHLIEDAIQLSKHLQNRGRPTERTWTKYKEAKAYRKEVQGWLRRCQQRKDDAIMYGRFYFFSEHVDEQKKEASSEKTNEAVQETSQSTSANKKLNHHLTKKPKIQEYKTIRYKIRTKNHVFTVMVYVAMHALLSENHSVLTCVLLDIREENAQHSLPTELRRLTERH